ncbi:MAG: hypothetical protein HY394_02295 [Candidatus Diapherotrites archaeon]|nr:hypothetical protein [Candidatus Diapherotrites archaeon]
MSRLEALALVLSERSQLAIFLAAFAVLLPLLAVSSAIISPVGFAFNPLAEPLGIALTIVIAILMGLNLTVLLHAHARNANAKKGTVLFGGLAATFATACPVCPPTWIVLLGFGSAAGFLSGTGIFIAIGSIVLLSLALYNSLGCADGNCGVDKNGKND